LEKVWLGSIDGGVQGRWRVRLPFQAGSDRRFRRGEVQPPLALHAERVQFGVQVHHRGWVRHQEFEYRCQGHQGSDLGHRWPGKVSSLFNSITLSTNFDLSFSLFAAAVVISYYCFLVFGFWCRIPLRFTVLIVSFSRFISITLWWRIGVLLLWYGVCGFVCFEFVYGIGIRDFFLWVCSKCIDDIVNRWLLVWKTCKSAS